MKVIWRIAKTELETLFFSPVAWIILMIFTFQVGLTFVNSYELLLRSQILEHGIWSATSNLFGGGIFSAVQDYLFLYLPLLTMGLMSREISSGSIKLLYSSPVKERDIILGKFLSMMIYCLVLLGVILLFVLFSAFTVKSLDYPAILSGFLGLFLLACAYSAIGLFMSCLISYQVAVAMGTLAVLAVLNYIGNVGQDIAFVREITYWLSISGRADSMLSGLICSDDVIYFLMVIGMFLVFSMLKIQSTKKHFSIFRNVARYGAVIIGVVIIGYVSSRPKLMAYYDTTSTKYQTLSKGSQSVMEKLDNKITIKTYVNIFDSNCSYGLPKNVMNDMQRFKHYIRFKPDTRMEYIYYYHPIEGEVINDLYAGLNVEERAKKVSEVYRLNFKNILSPEQISAQIDLKDENYTFVRSFEMDGDRQSFLRIYRDLSKLPSETEITAALLKLSGQSPVVAFLKGHGEPDIRGIRNRDYKYSFTQENYRYSLINQGFDIVELEIDNNPIPNNVDVLVVADIQNSLIDFELIEISRYIEKGGNILILGEPGKQNFINPLISQLGVSLKEGTLLQANDGELPTFVTSSVTHQALEIIPRLAGILNYGAKVTMPFVSAIDYDDVDKFNAIPVLMSENNGWNRVSKEVLSDDEAIQPNENEEVRAYTVGLALTREVNSKSQHIFILGDASCLSTGEMTTIRNGINSGNQTFTRELFSWLVDFQLPVNTSYQRPPDNRVDFEYDNLEYLDLLYLLLIPLLIALAGIMISLIRRKR